MRFFGVFVFCFGLSWAAHAAAETPLYEQDPFDQITLDENNGGVLLKVRPLDLPERRLPENPAPDKVLIVEIVDQPGRSSSLPGGRSRKWNCSSRRC